MLTYTAGTQRQRTDYRSFEPHLLNREWSFNSRRLIESLSKADRQLGRLDMFSEYVPNLDLFIQMHVVKEATQSSRIEDTKTEIEEAFLPEDEIAPERRDDWQEVSNYIIAMHQSIGDLTTLPFSTRLLCSAHKELMQGVRGERKTPGEYRRSQNWIGGSSPSNARFVPPIHDNVPEYMGDLELFAHNKELHIPPLLKIALMHYQFETIHPFLDGNGRIGRLMIPLFLISEGILKKPVLYISDFLERNRDEYYQRLTDVRTQNDIEGWLIFFLDGIAETADKGVRTFDQILQFQRQWTETIRAWKSQSKAGLLLLEALFSKPVTSAAGVAEVTQVSMPTVYKLIERFCKAELLVEITGAKRNKLFVFQPYLNLFK
jgi:Fic family protein